MIAAIAALTLLSQTAYREQFPLPGQTVPAGLGVNIHFLEPDNQLARIYEAGFRWIRTDFSWQRIETGQGQYDFAAYDRLLAGLRANHMRAILILDYGNPIYGEGSPRTPEMRRAFVHWVHASLQHFRRQGIVWEMYNEPNIKFWKPVPNVNEYAALAKEVGQEIRQNEPDEWFIGPAVSAIDFKYIKGCLDAGLLQYWDALSVHPYTGHKPETVLESYGTLKKMIDDAAPEGKSIPIICSEWGYPDSQTTEETQADFLARAYLTNLMAHVPIDIWYDWSDDPYDANAPDESHFGVVDRGLGNKQGFVIVKALTSALKGWRLAQVLSSQPYLYLVRFTKGDSAKYVAWAWADHQEALHVPDGHYTVTPLNGESFAADSAGSVLKIRVGPRPELVTP